VKQEADVEVTLPAARDNDHFVRVHSCAGLGIHLNAEGR